MGDNSMREKIAREFQAERKLRNEKLAREKDAASLPSKARVLLDIMEPQLVRMFRVGFNINDIKDAMNDIEALIKETHPKVKK